MRGYGPFSKRQSAKSVILPVTIFLLAFICNFAAWSQSTAPDPAIERGHKQFQQSCGFCHGPDATGARGPDLVRSSTVAHEVKGDLLGEIIRHGRPDKGMPPMPLADQQIAEISAYLHARAAEALRSNRVPKEYPLEKLLTGNAEAEKVYFHGAGGCASCHSPSGDLAGIATKYSPIDLQAKMLYPSGGTQKKTAVVTLPTGEQVKGVLTHIDEFEVALADSLNLLILRPALSSGAGTANPTLASRVQKHGHRIATRYSMAEA
jgi:mono/diheme cytochrome c family protein